MKLEFVTKGAPLALGTALVLGLGGCCKKLELNDCCAKPKACPPPAPVVAPKQQAAVKEEPAPKPIECKEKSVCKVTEQEAVSTCTLDPCSIILFGVTGQGVAPVNTVSPAQAKALARRAAIADAYRQLAEKIYGVRVEGDDYIRNMMVKRSTVRTHVAAMIRNARIVDTGMQDGLYEVTMELTLDGRKWYQLLTDY